MTFFKLTTAALAVTILSACGGSHSHSGIEISNARINAPIPGQTTAVGFMDIQNHDAADRLLAVTSPVSDRMELHTHTMEDGVMKMRRVDAIDLPTGEIVSLQPGSLHIMIFDADVVGVEDVTITLDYETADDVTLVVPILARGEMPEPAKMMGGHEGH